ncbi:MAG: ribosomal protein L13e [Candidatus Bathyarchaeia archaeon]
MAAVKPLVFKKGGEKRVGKGFSLDELKKAKLNVKQALKLGIPVDCRRRTAHLENVEALVKFLEEIRASKPKRKKAKPKRGKNQNNM